MNTKSIFSLMIMSLMTFVASAQFDDLYYDPNDDNNIIVDDVYTEEPTYTYTDSDDEYYSDDEGEYSDYDSDYYDDYSYTRRINRFRRNSGSSNFYSSVYYNDFNQWNDPFYNPHFGASTLFI